jgi:hypothetical protein
LASKNIGISLIGSLFCFFREEKHSSCCCHWGGRLMHCNAMVAWLRRVN